MAMREEIWIDGFNLFHCWEETRDCIRGAREMGPAIGNCLRCLSSALGRWRSRTVVFLDGGLCVAAETAEGVSVRYPGPGRKADDAMREFLQGRERRGRSITAVSNDRALSASLRAYGVEMMGVEDFLVELARRPHRRGRASGGERRPDRALSAAEVEAWVALFEDQRRE